VGVRQVLLRSQPAQRRRLVVALTSFGQARPSSGSDGGAITPSFNHGWIRMPFNGPVPGFSLIRSSPYDDAAAWRREYLK